MGKLIQKYVFVVSIFLILTFLCTFSAYCQNLDSLKVYVWDFTTNEREFNGLTMNFTEEFEESLSQICTFEILERRNYDWLNARFTSERELANLEDIPANILDSLKLIQANAVFFGLVKDDINEGTITVTVKLLSFDSHLIKRCSVSIRRGLRLDSETRRKAMRDLAEKICLASPSSYQEKNFKFIKASIPVYLASAIWSSLTAIHYQEKADEKWSEIPEITSEERVRAFGEYKRFKTRSNLCYLTASNIALNSLPFCLKVKKNKLRLNKKTYLTGFFFLKSVAFCALAYNSGQMADETKNKFNGTGISEERVSYKGKYETYKEKEKFYYINSFIDILSATEAWLWYDKKNDEKRVGLYLHSPKSPKIYIEHDYANWLLAWQIRIVFNKAF